MSCTAEYAEHLTTCARYGFSHAETTETGFAELRAIGFTADDIYCIECDVQAGYTVEESTAALTRA